MKQLKHKLDELEIIDDSKWVIDNPAAHFQNAQVITTLGLGPLVNDCQMC